MIPKSGDMLFSSLDFVGHKEHHIMTAVESLMGSNTPEWPDDLDALVAAPAHHKLLFENERVRVLETRIAAGDRTPVHTHRWPGALYILSWSHFLRYDDQDRLIIDSRAVEAFKNSPTVAWTKPLPPHWLQNIGASELAIIAVELKGDTV